MRDAVVLVLVAVSIGACLRGWMRSEMAAKIPWEPSGLNRLVLLSAGAWMAFGALQLLGRRRQAPAAAAAALVALVACAGAVPVVATLALLLAATAVGDWLWTRAADAEAGIHGNDAVAMPLRVALGLAVLMTIVQALGPLPVHGSLFYVLLVAVPIALRARALRALLAPILVEGRTQMPIADRLLVGLLGNFVVVIGVAALLPEVGHDALALHLDVAARVRDAGRWHYDVLRNIFAVIPLGGDYLYAIGYVFGGEQAARLVNLSMLLVTLWLVYGAVRRPGSRRIALLATIIAASSPLALLATASLFVENPLALFVVAAMICALSALDDASPRMLYLAALLFGAAVATKLIAVALLPALAATVAVWWLQRTRRVPLRTLASIAAVALAFAATPYAIALAQTGNPVFPLYNAIFESPLYPAVNFRIAQFPGALDPLAPYRMTFYSDRYLEGLPGSFGFALLLLAAPVLVAAPVWGSVQMRLLAFAVASYFAIAVAGSAYLRYVYPTVFLFAIVVGRVVAQLPLARAVRFTLVASGATAIALDAAFLPAATAQLRSLDLAAAADRQHRERYVTTWAPMRDIVRFLNAYRSDPSAVLVLGAAHIAELDRASYTDSGYMREIRERLRGIGSAGQLRELVRTLDVGFVALDSSERPALRTLVQSLAQPIYRSGIATLYRVDTKIRFARELVRAPVLAPDAPGWVVHGNVGWDGTGGALVDASNVVYQPVALTAERRYRLAVEAKCAGDPAPLRLQVNWLGSSGRELGPTLHVLPCSSDWREEEALISAPDGAATAVVYAAGHSTAAVQVRSVSLRSR